MISKVIFSVTGIGQPVLMADGVAKTNERILIVAPRALHTQWRADLQRAGADCSLFELTTPEKVASSSGSVLNTAGHVLVDEVFPASLSRIATALRDCDAPVTLRVGLGEYVRLALKLERSPMEAAKRIAECFSGEPMFIRCDEDAIGVLQELISAACEYDRGRGGVEARLSLEAIENLLKFPADFLFSDYVRATQVAASWSGLLRARSSDDNEPTNH